MNIGAVSQAIINRLGNFTALSSKVSYIGVDKPQDAQAESLTPFPYCVVEEATGVAWDTKTSDGGNELVQVTVFCRPTATRSAHSLANELAQATYDALHKFELVVPGSNVVNCLFEESPGVIRDPDGKTRYRPMTFRIVYSGG